MIKPLSLGSRHLPILEDTGVKLLFSTEICISKSWLCKRTVTPWRQHTTSTRKLSRNQYISVLCKSNTDLALARCALKQTWNTQATGDLASPRTEAASWEREVVYSKVNSTLFLRELNSLHGIIPSNTHVTELLLTAARVCTVIQSTPVYAISFSS